MLKIWMMKYSGSHIFYMMDNELMVLKSRTQAENSARQWLSDHQNIQNCPTAADQRDLRDSKIMITQSVVLSEDEESTLKQPVILRKGTIFKTQLGLNVN